SMLFVPADSEKKLGKALESGADALILDLEDSVAAANKPQARDTARAFLAAHAATKDRPLLMVRVNALDT
ncbi:aldolase/citrate lyase family protein, partial [Proteus mirabilis]|uniref:aldolase/citrate lyase family protein n=1 Tax=Proteus mirabilis TaxID=584 RepID=UPI001EF76071